MVIFSIRIEIWAAKNLAFWQIRARKSTTTVNIFLNQNPLQLRAPTSDIPIGGAIYIFAHNTVLSQFWAFKLGRSKSSPNFLAIWVFLAKF
jgi:hypothetical protein